MRHEGGGVEMHVCAWVGKGLGVLGVLVGGCVACGRGGVCALCLCTPDMFHVSD